MKKYLLIGIIAGLLVLGGTLLLTEHTVKATFNGYTYQRTLTVANASSTQSNFPVLISFNSTGSSTVATDLKASSSSGVIMTLTASGTPADLIFSTTTDASSILPFEIEKYASTTGELLAWVNMPTVANNQILYMYYGKSGDSDHRNIAGTWDSNYKGVWHLLESPTGGAPQFKDSTSNGKNLTRTTTSGSPTTTTGQIDGAVNFPTVSQYNGTIATTTGNIGVGTSNNYTTEVWVNMNSAIAHDNHLVTLAGSGASSPPGSYAGQGLAVDDRNYAFYNIFANSTFGQNKTATSTNTLLATSTWYSLAGTNNGTILSFYLNGTLMATSTSGATHTITDNPAGINIVYGGIFSSAKFDEFRISTSTRPSNWIKTEYNNEYDPTTFWTVSGASTGGGGTSVPPIPNEVQVENVNLIIRNLNVIIKQP